MLVKKSSTSRYAKPKPAKKGDDSSKTYSDIMPFEGGLPLMDNIVLESSPLPSAHTCSNKRPTAGKSKSTALRPSTDAPSSKTQGNKRKTSLPSTERRSKHKENVSATSPILLNEPKFEAKLEPISIYHPMVEEIFASMGTPMEGFFDGVDVVFEAMASATPTAT
uniref:Uncharacterized protein n=1 Tax=Quercus lobata TaxID=97700 RepID=A0A7N2RDL2_QUELO